MSSYAANVYPFVFAEEMGMPLEEASHTWDSTLPSVLAAIAGSERYEAPFEQAVRVEVPLILVYPPIRIDGFCKLTFRQIEKGGKKVYLARLQCFGQGDPNQPYLELDSKSDCAELAMRHLTYNFASYLFAVEGEVESVR